MFFKHLRKLSPLFWAALCLTLSAPPAGAQSDTPAETQTSLPTLQIGARNISAYTRKLLGKTTVGGYFDTEYIFPADGQAFFDQHHVILQVSSLMNERLFFNTEVEFEHGALLNTGTNDGEIRVEQAYLDYKIEDWLVLRSGALLIPVGRLNVLHDSDFRDTTARPLFSQTIVPTTWTETGLGFYGTVYPNDMWELNYEAYLVQGLKDGLADGPGLSGARGSLSADNNNNKGFTARVGLSPFIGLDFGLSTYLSAYNDAGDKNLGLFVGDFTWTWGPFELLGEGGFAAFDPTTAQAVTVGTDADDVLVGGSTDETDETDAESDTASAQPLLGPMWGYYLEAHYHLFPEFLRHSFLSNGFEEPVITLFARISQVDTDLSQLNLNDRTRLTLGLNYRPTTNTAFKLEYQWNLENEAFLRNDPSHELANNQVLASVAAGF